MKMTHTMISALLVFLAVSVGCSGAQFERSEADTSSAAHPAGTVVDWTHLGRMPIPGHPTQQADVYRFTYVTESDRAQVATARLAVPTAHFQSFDLVAHLHGTIGFADHCAPSRMPGFGFESPLNPIPGDMVAAGRVVVMPDYPGLGAPGRHRYVELDATGRSVWDSLVAARDLVGVVRPASTVSDEILLMGHSQGGHATLAALATQRDDDPFDVVGAVAFAPPGDPARHAQLVAAGEARAAPLAWALMSYARAYPDEVEAQKWFDERVTRKLPELMETRCAPTITVWLGPTVGGIFTDAAIDHFRAGEIPNELAPILERERFDDFRTDTELVIYHGTRDGLLPSELSRELSERLAANGNTVEWHAVEGAGHLTVPRRVRGEVLAWVDERLD